MKPMIVVVLMFVVNVAAAAVVTPNSPDGVAAILQQQGLVILCNDGRMWSLVNQMSSAIQWEPYSYGYPLPVPVSQISDIEIGYLTTITGEHWAIVGPSASEPMGWHRLGAPELPALPCGAGVESKKDSLGGVKSLFR